MQDSAKPWTLEASLAAPGHDSAKPWAMPTQIAGGDSARPWGLPGSAGTYSVPIVEGQRFAKAGSASESPGVLNITGTVPVGNHLIVMVGMSGGRILSSVTDTKGNVYVVNAIAGNGSFAGISIASAKITTQLVNGDSLNLVPNVACFMAGVAQEFSGLHPSAHFRSASVGNGGPTAVLDGATTSGNSSAGDLVVGAFCGDNANCAILTPGAGYTDELGAVSTGTVMGFDWESKVATGGSAERAQATAVGASNNIGLTAIFAKA